MKKYNLAPLVKWMENITIFRVFLGIIVLPMIVGFITLGMMEHKGTSYLVTHEVDIYISIGGEPAGTMTLGLFGRDVPKTVRNFVVLSGPNGHEGHKYEGTSFHRVIRAFVIQGGDVFKGADNEENLPGKGSISIFGQTFPDENFIVSHAGPGFVSMANHGPDTNGCQFFITLRATTFLDGKHVVFGKVIKNKDLINKIEMLELDKHDRPVLDVIITRTVARQLSHPYYQSNDPYNVWDWAKVMTAPIIMCGAICGLFAWLMSYLDAGIASEDARNKLIKQAQARAAQKIDEEDEGEDEANANVRKRTTKSGSIDGSEEVSLEAKAES